MDGPWQVPWSTQSFDQGNEEFDSVAYFFDPSYSWAVGSGAHISVLAARTEWLCWWWDDML